MKIPFVPKGPELQADYGNNCVVGGAHAFLLRVSSFFGLAPLRFTSLSNGYAVSISGTMCIYSYVLVTVVAICTIIGLMTDIYHETKHPLATTLNLSIIIYSCDELLVVAIACVAVYYTPRRMRTVLKLMENIAVIDNSIGAQYSAATERKLYIIIIATLIFFIAFFVDVLIMITINAIEWEREFGVFTHNLALFFLWHMVLILELQFAFTAMSIRARFAAVNDLLDLTARNISPSGGKSKLAPPINFYAIEASSVVFQRSPNVSVLVNSEISREPVSVIIKTATGEPRLIVSPCDAICRLASLHEMLCDIVNVIDDSYGLPLIMILISTLLHMIVAPYFLIINLFVSTDQYHYFIMQFVWCVIHLLRMIALIEPGHYTIAEEKRTKGLVSRLISSVSSAGALSSRLKVFARQLLLQPTGYVPLRICTLNRPLMVSVLAAVITYLVIIMQFEI